MKATVNRKEVTVLVRDLEPGDRVKLYSIGYVIKSHYKPVRKISPIVGVIRPLDEKDREPRQYRIDFDPHIFKRRRWYGKKYEEEVPDFAVWEADDTATVLVTERTPVE